MADDLTKVGALFEGFASGFLRPLLVGGEARAVRALPSGLLHYFAHATPNDSSVAEAIAMGVLDAAMEIAPLRAVPQPDRSAMALVMAAHDLAVVTDPMLDRAVARKARPTVLQWAWELTEAIAPPRSRGEALHRHVWLDRFLRLVRRDTVVRNWAYTYRFHGRPPPPNVVAMPRLRLVRQERTEVSLMELIDADEDELGLRSLLDALLARSPVTQLLRWSHVGRLRFGAAALACLSDRRLRAGVVHAIVRSGIENADAVFGFALRELHAQAAPPPHLEVALSFLVELQLVALLDRRTDGDPSSTVGPPNSPSKNSALAPHRQGVASTATVEQRTSPGVEPSIARAGPDGTRTDSSNGTPEQAENSDDAKLFTAVLPALVATKPDHWTLRHLTTADRRRVVARAYELEAEVEPEHLEFVRFLLVRSGPLSVSSPPS